MTGEMMAETVEGTIEEMVIVITIVIVTIVKMDEDRVMMIIEEINPHLQ